MASQLLVANHNTTAVLFPSFDRFIPGFDRFIPSFDKFNPAGIPITGTLPLKIQMHIYYNINKIYIVLYFDMILFYLFYLKWILF